MKLFEKKEEGIFREAIEGMVYPGSGKAVIAAIDVRSLMSLRISFQGARYTAMSLMDFTESAARPNF